MRALSKMGLKGLGRVVFRTQFDTFHHAVEVVKRRNNEDGDVTEIWIALKLLQDLIAVHTRHHDIEQDQVELACLNQLECSKSVFGNGYAIPLPF